MTSLHDSLATIPLGTYVGASRYDTDVELVLSVYVNGATYDLRAPKDTAAACSGRHCRHDGLCYRTPGPYDPGHLAPITPAYPPFVPTCTCGQLWNSILPPPPCPAHGTCAVLEVTSISASSRWND